MLRLEHIGWNTEEGNPVLKDLSLEVPDGRLMVITGPNGGGKTTLAKVIAGIVKPATGRIYFDDRDITELNVTERARLGFSFAFQQPVRFKGMTVRRLLDLAAGGKASYEQMCEMLGRVGLCAREYVNREVNATLSGGEIKRIEIATVLARHTRLSVFDEPEAGIDLWSFSNLIDVFNDMRGKLEGTLLIISHQERILQIADEIAVVANGTLREVGPAAEVMQHLMPGEDVSATCARMGGRFHE